MRKIHLSHILAFVVVFSLVCFGWLTVSADYSTSWNFSDTNFRNLETISSTQTVDGLSLIATSNKTMSVISSSQTLNGTTYNYCLALGGAGSSSYRAVSFNVTGTSTIKVTAKSSGSDTRTLAVVNDSGTQVGSISCSSTLATNSITITGTGTLYLYSTNCGINLYKIQVDTKETSNSDSSDSNNSNSSNSMSTAIDADGFPDQRMQFVNAEDGAYMTAASSSSNASINSNTSCSTLNQWKLIKSGSDYYKLVNVASGNVLIPKGNSASSGTEVVVSSSPSGSSQYWKIVAVKSDSNSNHLNYKIVNYANTDLALTLSNSAYILTTYQGSASQCFRFNTYGAEGFAGYSKTTDGEEKASVTGGVLGDIVYVTNVTDLQTYASGSTPYTIVINQNLSASSLTKVTVGQNKTFVGSFNNHTLNNIHFRCISNSGNVIFRNITFSHDGSINANDDIQVYISNGVNFWLDHCTFTGHSSITSSDVDKLLYVGLKADYVSVTGSTFMNHKYGLILGYPEEDGVGTYDGYPRMTIANNYFYNVLTRAPGLMRYGYFHCYNNFVYGFNLGYTPYTGCNIYSEKNYFDAGNYTGAVVDDKGVGGFTDSGSVLSSSVSSLKTGATSWRPSSNYSYSTRTANAAKTWCQNYCGSQSSTLTYAID